MNIKLKTQRKWIMKKTQNIEHVRHLAAARNMMISYKCNLFSFKVSEFVSVPAVI